MAAMAIRAVSAVVAPCAFPMPDPATGGDSPALRRVPLEISLRDTISTVDRSALDSEAADDPGAPEDGRKPHPARSMTNPSGIASLARSCRRRQAGGHGELKENAVTEEQIKSLAAAQTRKERAEKQAEDALKARTEAANQAQHVQDRTIKLRALRLAKEQADALAAAKAAKTVKAKAKA
ncbi:MAG: hypothetical protein J0H01_10815 [Rhizobiales bacterium]|nr:hypothetical protein [Hyphomicrobiales bacterium]